MYPMDPIISQRDIPEGTLAALLDAITARRAVGIPHNELRILAGTMLESIPDLIYMHLPAGSKVCGVRVV